MLCVSLVRLRLPCCVSSLKRRGRRWLPCLRPRFYRLRFAFRLAYCPVLPHVLCLAAGVGRLVSCVLLVLDTHIAPPLRHEGRGDIVLVSFHLLVRFFSHPMRMSCARLFLRSLALWCCPTDCVVSVSSVISSVPSCVPSRSQLSCVAFSSLKRRVRIIHLG